MKSPLSSTQPPSHLPDEFHFAIGGYFGGTHELTFRSGALEYSTQGLQVPAPIERLEPTAEAWARFWQALHRAKVWEWQPVYESGALDGTQWQLTLAHGTHRISTHGSNAYPGGRDCAYSAASSFGRFLRALRTLTGKQIA